MGPHRAALVSGCRRLRQHDGVLRAWGGGDGLWDSYPKACSQIITAMSHSAASQLIATAHPDRAVRVWDPRVAEGLVVRATVHATRALASSVDWVPGSSQKLAVGSYDGAAKLLDIRSTTPLASVAAHEGDVSSGLTDGRRADVCGALDGRAHPRDRGGGPQGAHFQI